jgi:hypothetical protein
VHFGFETLFQCTKFFLSARTRNANPRIYITQAGWDAMTHDDEVMLNIIASMESGSVVPQWGTRCRAHRGVEDRPCTVDGCISLRLLPPPPPPEEQEEAIEEEEEKEEKEGKRSDVKALAQLAAVGQPSRQIDQGVHIHGGRGDQDVVDGAEDGARQDAHGEAGVVRPVPMEEVKQEVEPARENQGAVDQVRDAAHAEPSAPQAADVLIDVPPPQGVNHPALPMARMVMRPRIHLHRPALAALAGFGKLPPGP